MIIQLPNGRILEVSLELYLELSDAEINELNGLGVMYTNDVGNDPFYNSFSKKSAKSSAIEDMEDEYEPDLDEIDPYTKMEDKDFQSDD
jgi:hypothetical protein